MKVKYDPVFQKYVITEALGIDGGIGCVVLEVSEEMVKQARQGPNLPVGYEHHPCDGLRAEVKVTKSAIDKFRVEHEKLVDRFDYLETGLARRINSLEDALLRKPIG